VLDRTALGLRQQATDRLLRRLEGLTDDEYLWEPGPGCWSVRLDADGRWRSEWRHHAPPPEPFTTIAARMWHLGAQPWDLPELTREAVIAAQFVEPYCPEGHDPQEACGSAAEAVAAIEHSQRRWQAHFDTVSDTDLLEPMGETAGPYSGDNYFGLLVHHVDEYIHHSAEVALLRDFHRISR
jgi:uncharacterized damage-inducible protein DinB